MKIKNLKDTPSIPVQVNRTGELLTNAQSLSQAFGLSGLLVHREKIPPGCRASTPHFHSTKEEIFLVESGNPSLWIEGEVTKLQAGDFIGFGPGRPARMIFNDSDNPAEIYTIGTNPPDDEVTYFQNDRITLQPGVVPSDSTQD
ncbi:MAG: cupin domain-containing protein [Bdellovibrionales bacterium]|nr:cupin domain-containing protein [Bdellovibrionales bacterium]